MQIRNALLAELEARFGAPAFHIEDDAMVFPAAHPSVGAVTVTDDGDEATVTIGAITHRHFNNLDLPLEAAAPGVAKEVADFLEILFAGRLVIWQSHSKSSDGWWELEDGDEPKPRKGKTNTFIWQGPIPR